MPRKPRFYLPDLPQHVVQRGNNRDPCFYATPDYQFYLTVLGDALVNHRCQLHAYVLMTNHVHLLVTPLHQFGLPQLMQAIGRKYVQYINRSYRRSGTLWEGRYKASLVDSESWLLTCMRYIEMNPVRAGMVSHPGEYSWSSYACNAQGTACALLTPHVLYQALGPDPEERRHACREMFRCSLNDGQVHEIRAVLSQELVLGRENFKDRIAVMTQRRVRRGKDGRPSMKRGREEQ